MTRSTPTTEKGDSINTTVRQAKDETTMDINTQPSGPMEDEMPLDITARPVYYGRNEARLSKEKSCKERL